MTTNSLKSLKTPLRYPGGKSRACKKIEVYLPKLDKYKEFREPFLGGGSVSIHFTKLYPGISFWVNDLYKPIYNFWTQLQKNGSTMQIELEKIKKQHSNTILARDLFLKSQELINDKGVDDLRRAMAFYIVNKCSFSGLTESSAFSEQASESNFSLRGIGKLSEYSKIIANWKITNQSYETLMDSSADVFMYLDPPYEIKSNLYGKKGSMHKSFDHDKFAADCNANKMHQLISYNASDKIKSRFDGWTAGEFDLTYTMQSVGDYKEKQKKRKELVLFNY